MSKLSIVIKSAWIDFSAHGYEDWMMKSTGGLNNLLIRKTSNDFRCDFVASVLLPQLSVVVSPHTIHRRNWVIDLSLVLRHENRMIVAARDIGDLSLSQRTNERRSWQIWLGAVTELAIVIVAASVELAFWRNQRQTLAAIRRRQMSDPNVLQRVNFLR